MIEVWFVALAAMQGETTEKKEVIPFMFTGNDFGSLHTRRFEQHGEEPRDPEEPLAPMLLEHDDRARHHTAGVTSILALPVPMVDDAPVLLTGSYDEGLRIYHATRRGEVLAEEGLGGGVWRLQLLNLTETGSASSGVCGEMLLGAGELHACWNSNCASYSDAAGSDFGVDY